MNKVFQSHFKSSQTDLLYSSPNTNSPWLSPCLLVRVLLPLLFPRHCLELVLSLVTAVSLESHVTTDGQSASLSWNKAPIWGLRPDFYFCLTVAGLLILGDLSDERTGLSFTIPAGLRQRSHFRVRVS
jgi:hypothetical protein